MYRLGKYLLYRPRPKFVEKRQWLAEDYYDPFVGWLISGQWVRDSRRGERF